MSVGAAAAAQGLSFIFNQAYKEIENERQKEENIEAENRQFNRNMITMNKSYDLNEMAADNADARTRALYNDLYSPEAKVKQLKDAGLSVGLMYGGSGASGTSSTSGAQGSVSGGLTNISYARELQNQRQTDAQISLTHAQILDTLADAKKKGAETTGVNLENKLNEATLETNVQQAQAELAETLSKKDLNLSEKQLNEINTRVQKVQERLSQYQDDINQMTMSETLYLIRATAEKAVSDADIAKTQNKYSEEVTQKEINLLTAQCAETWAKKALLVTQNMLEDKKIELTEKEIEKINAELPNIAAEYWKIITEAAVNHEKVGETRQKIENLKAEKIKTWTESGKNTADAIHTMTGKQIESLAKVIDAIIPF